MVLAFLNGCVSHEMQNDRALVTQTLANFLEEILMRFGLIGLGIFFFTFSALAGTFLDTFDDGKLVGWQELVLFGVDAPGTWEIVNGELQAISEGGITCLLTIGEETWEDYDIEFDVKPLERRGPGGVAVAARIMGTSGVVCEVGDTNAPGKSEVQCFGGDLHGRAFLVYDQEPHPLLKLQKWIAIKLSVHGKRLTFWINGKQVLGPIALEPLHGFPEFPTGKIGLGLANYTARFDNLKITGPGIPDKGGLSITSHAKLATVWGNLKRF